jgi:hypothetical protein
MTLEADIDRALGGGKKGPCAPRSKIVATLIKDYPSKHGRMYFLRLSRPVKWSEYDSSYQDATNHVVVSESASYDPETKEPLIIETVILPAYPDGRIASHRFLKQYPNLIDWKRAVKRAGWVLASDEQHLGGKRRKAKQWTAADQRAYARQQEAEALRLSKDPSRCWRCGQKESDCRCASVGNYAGYGGKRRHAVAAKIGPRGGRTEIQAYLFPRKLTHHRGFAVWDQRRVMDWLARNGHEVAPEEIHVTDDYYRVRVENPESFRRLRTKCLSRRRGTCMIKSIIGVR